MYDVSPETIRRLLRGETYKNLPEGAQNLHYGEEIQAKAAQSVEELKKILEADGLAPKEVGEGK